MATNRQHAYQHPGWMAGSGRFPCALDFVEYPPLLLHIVALFCCWRMDQPLRADANRSGYHGEPFGDGAGYRRRSWHQYSRSQGRFPVPIRRLCPDCALFVRTSNADALLALMAIGSGATLRPRTHHSDQRCLMVIEDRISNVHHFRTAWALQARRHHARP
jgi:hypothetical protein